MPIRIADLKESDRGRRVIFTDPDSRDKHEMELFNWNERYVFLAWPGTNRGGHTSPENVEFVKEMSA